MIEKPHVLADKPPVLKVGAVILRMLGEGYVFLVVQPRPKPHTPDDLPPVGFLRGTRMYRDRSGHFTDANHDGTTPPPEGAVLEPMMETLVREIEEEAGITPEMLRGQRLIEMGPRLFLSTRKPPYPIHWFILLLDENTAAALHHSGLKDSLHTTWMTLDRIRGDVAVRKASPGYLAVAEEALGMLLIEGDLSRA